MAKDKKEGFKKIFSKLWDESTSIFRPKKRIEASISVRVVTNRSASGTASLVWKGEGQSIKVGRFKLANPMVYVSIDDPCEDEPSCINKKLMIGNPISESRESKDYHPHYSGLTPNQRANYLSWISSGRKGKLDNIRYAFIFFYGLERRVFIDHEDACYTILNEARRLMELYTFSKSFLGYLSRFITYVIASSFNRAPIKSPEDQKNIEALNTEWFNYVDECIKHFLISSSFKWDEQSLALALAWIVKRKNTIPVKLALGIAKNNPYQPQRAVLKRKLKAVEELFISKYEKIFNQGIQIKVLERELKITRILEYRYGNTAESFRRQFHLNRPTVRIPDILRYRDKLLPIFELWNECIKDVK